MTIDIDTMPAGPEMDRLVCEAVGIEPVSRMFRTKVLDEGRMVFDPKQGAGGPGYPAVSTKPDHMMEVLEKMDTGGYDVHIDRVKPLRSGTRLWYVAFLKGPFTHQNPIRGDGRDPRLLSTAVCRAAYKAKSHSKVTGK